MRICLVTTEYFSHGIFGGIGAMARQKATALARRGVEVYVVTPRKKGQKPIEVMDGVTVLSYPGQLYTGLQSSRRYSAIFRAIDADIYHTEEPCMGTRLAWEGAPKKKHSVTVIDPRTLTERRKEWQEAGLSGRALWKRMFTHWRSSFDIRTAVRGADRRFVQAKFAAAKAMKLYGLREAPGFLPNPIALVPNGVPKTARPTVCFLGRWDPRKRPEYFFELAKRFPEVRFIAMGGCQPHFKARETQLRERYRHVPNLEMPGWQFGDDKTRILEQSWILINTSWRENLPFSYLEAASRKCALLAFDNSDDFSSSFGYWARRGDLDDFTQGLRFLLEGDRWRALGERGYAYVRQTHEFEKVMDLHMQIFNELCNGRARSRG